VDEQEKMAQIDATLEGIVSAIDALDHDAIEAESADGKVALLLESGEQLILSRQSATGQIWLAEPSGGWHFDWNGSMWLCDKRGIELIQTLEDLLAGRVGEPVDLR